ncbi:hypothetical protein PVK06_048055 [Gossypium arboreum]|uniref:SWIM-type domain-containing protein n=1 Tax=Gossypium arboreum TaxID=29729 RepID=A0ABR0MEX9_GOSAR|nr:hypothetical protein PVK06_048055 [Gossypium arboreum]
MTEAKACLQAVTVAEKRGFHKLKIEGATSCAFMLFAELAGVEVTEDPTTLGEEVEAQEPCMVVLVSYVGSQSTIHGIDIDLNATPETAVVGDDVYHNSDPSDHEVDSDSDPDVDEVPDDIDDEGLNKDGNELFVGQRFESKEECVFAIKLYSMIISVDYKVVVSKPTLYIGECWKSTECCNWRIRAAFIQKSQMWEIRKFVGSHTCTSTRITEDHRKIDSKTIYTCTMPMVEDMPTIKVSDGNKNVLPIVFAIVDKENMESWEFFLTNLRMYVIGNDNICIISDKGKGLIAAIRHSGVPWRSVYCIRHIAANFHRNYKNPDWKRQFVKIDCNLYFLNTYTTYELEPHIFRQRMTRLESDMEGQMNTSLRQWLGTMESWQWAQSFDEGFRYGQMTTNLGTKNGSATSQLDGGRARVCLRCQGCNGCKSSDGEVDECRKTISCRPSIPPRSYGVDLRNRRCDCRRFQTFHYPCAHVVAACAKVSFNVDQFTNEVYTLERTLRVWENEFPMLHDLSTWEVPPTTFELVPNKGLHRNPKGRPQSFRIRNKMEIREKSDGKLCRVCRLAGHNRSKCPLRNYHIGQSLRSDRN